MKHIKQHILFIIVIAILIVSCGADEDAVFEPDSDKAPRISIEKLSQEVEGNTVTATFKLVSDSKVKTDTVIRFRSQDADWTDMGCLYNIPNEVPNNPKVYKWQGVRSSIITKGKKDSQPITARCYLNERMAAWIVPMPIITVAGEGEMIDHEFLRSQTPKSVSDVVLPNGFLFPYYEIADTQTTLLYVPKTAKVISVDPPINSTLRKTGTNIPKITITFDTPPECPTLSAYGEARRLRQTSPSVFSIELQNYRTRGLRPLSFNIKWGKGHFNNPQKHSFDLNYMLIVE